MHTRSVTLIDLFDHAVDISGRKVHAYRRSNNYHLGRNFAAGFAPAGLNQRLADPFGNGHAPQTRCALDIAIFRVLNDDLQTLSHIMSLFDSSR